MLRIIIVLSLLVALSSSCDNPQSEVLLDEVQSAIDLRADSLLSASELHAVSIGVIQSGKRYLSHYGELDPGGGIPPNDSTIYEIASVTKTFTGTLLAHAISEGVLRLEDDIRPYLPGDFQHLAYAGSPITVAHLATHTAGLPQDFPELPTSADSTAAIRDALLTGLRSTVIDTLPGARYLYSNVGANVLAYVLEKAYDQPLDSLFDRLIYRKADMHSTGFMLREGQKVNFAKGYGAEGSIAPFMPPTSWAAAGLKSTLPDLLNFVAFHLDESRPEVKRSHEKLLDHSNPAAYRAYYWLVNTAEDGTRRLSCHGGGMGFQAWVMFYPESETGIVVLTNKSDPQTGGRIIDVAKKIAADLGALERVS